MPLINLIVNGGFETGALPPWTGVGASVTSAYSHSGTYSAELSTDSVNAFIAQLIPVVPGHTYDFEASLARIGPLPSTTIGILLAYYDASFNYLGTGLNIALSLIHI